MRFTLFDLLLVFLPIAVFAMAFRPLDRTIDPIEWQPFRVSLLESELTAGRDVLVLVTSTYGGDSPNLVDRFQFDPGVSKAIHAGRLVPLQIEHAYLTKAPPGMEEETQWVLSQRASSKYTFLALCTNDVDTAICQDPSTADDLLIPIRGTDNRANYLYAGFAILMILSLRAAFIALRNRPGLEAQ